MQRDDRPDAHVTGGVTMPRAQANAVDCLLSAEADLRCGAGPNALDRRTASAGSICGSPHAARCLG